MENKLPGTALACGNANDAFAVIEPIFAITKGLTLSQVVSVTGLSGSTIQNWIKRGWVAAPKGKRYGKRQVVRIILINMLRSVMRLEDIICLLCYINGNVEDESDDMIPEDILYSHLCSIIAQMKKLKTASNEVICLIIDSRLDGQQTLGSDAKKKLKSALLIMALAYQASSLKELSNAEFNKLNININK